MEKNKIFDVKDLMLNRDDILFPFFRMKEIFTEKEISIFVMQ